MSNIVTQKDRSQLKMINVFCISTEIPVGIYTANSQAINYAPAPYGPMTLTGSDVVNSHGRWREPPTFRTTSIRSMLQNQNKRKEELSFFVAFCAPSYYTLLVCWIH